MRHEFSLSIAVFVALGVVFARPLFAQDYPAKSVRLIIGFPPGGGVDIVARQLMPRVGDLLGQQVVIDNRGGAGGNIALELTAKAPPDGYTLMFTTPTLTINPALYPKINYDPVRDFAPVGLVASTVYMLVVHPSLPVKSMPELIALAKAKPRQLFYSSGGNGAAAHLAGELFRSMSGTQIVHVPYKGVAPALIAALSGEAHLTFASQPASLPHVKQGKLRALAVTSAKRSAFTPEYPSIAEAGLPGYETTAWYGIIAPAKTPRAVITRFNNEVIRAADHPDSKAGFANQSFENITGTPEQFGTFIKDELVKWSRVVKEAGMRID